MFKILIITTFIAFQIKSAIAVIGEAPAYVIDTCNCPNIEEFSADIQSILAQNYMDAHQADVPLEFDQLTLLIDMKSKVEFDLACSETNGELNSFEREVSETLLDKEVSELIKNSLQYSSKINLGEFSPNFMRIASDSDRTLFFKANIAGEDKYIIMKILRNGQSQIEFLDTIASPLVSFPDKMPKESSKFALINPEPISPIRSRNKTKAYGSQSGIKIKKLIETDNFNTLNLEAALLLEEQLISPSPIREGRPKTDSKVDMRLNAGQTMHFGEERKIELRTKTKSLYDSKGYLDNRFIEAGSAYHDGDYALDIVAHADKQKDEVTSEYRFGNTHSYENETLAIRSGLKTSAPAIPMNKIPKIKDINLRNSNKSNDIPLVFSAGIKDSPTEGAQSANFILYNQNGQKMNTLSGSRVFETGDYSLAGAGGTKNKKASFKLSDSQVSGRTFSLESYTNNYYPEKGQVETIAGTTFVEDENKPSKMHLDQITTKEKTSSDGLQQETDRQHKGVTFHKDESLTLEYASTLKTQFNIDTEEGLKPLAAKSEHMALETTLADEKVIVRGVAMSQDESISGYISGTGGDLIAIWTKDGEAIETGVTLFSGTSRSSSSCRLGIRKQSGSTIENTSPLIFRPKNRETFNCNAVVVEDELKGLKVELDANYTLKRKNGTEYFVAISGDFEDKELQDQVDLNFGVKIILDPSPNPKSPLTDKEKRKLIQFGNR